LDIEKVQDSRRNQARVNKVNNAIKRLLVSRIFVHRAVNNGGRSEQSHTADAGLFTSFMLVHEAVNK
jgi:hypothetical protein